MNYISAQECHTKLETMGENPDHHSQLKLGINF